MTQETHLLLPGPAGELELLFSPVPSGSEQQSIAVICHPHPLYGGTMNNKVVTTLAKTFLQLNMPTVRFNFRGVGQSAGSYGQAEGELQDLFAVLAWVKETAPQAELWLAGFSFGAYIAIRAAVLLQRSHSLKETALAGLVTVAPPVNHFPLGEPVKITCPWLVVQGGQDEIVPSEAVLAWLADLDPKPRLISFPEAGHFFHGGLTELKQALIEQVSVYL